MSSGSGSGSVSSRANGVMGSSRCGQAAQTELIRIILCRADSSLSASFQKRHSHFQARVNSAKKKSQNDLINIIGTLKIQLQVRGCGFVPFYF